MRNILRNIFIAAAVLCTASCTLKENNEAYVSPYAFYSSLGECQAAVRGCYQSLRAIYNKDMMMASEGVTDLINASGSATQDAQLMLSPATARFGVTMWRQGYIGVRNCNMCIDGIQNSGLDPEKTAPLLAEAKTMRAFFYYLLTCMFGDVPYYTDVIRNVEDLERIEKLPRMSAFETRATLIKELQDCVTDLPEGRAYDVAGQHAGSAFCYMVIAKMAMWNEDWDSAEAALLKLEEFYGEYTRSAYPIEDNCFSAKDTPESIFEIQHYHEVGGLSVTTNLACYMTPHRGNGETDIYDGVQIPELGKTATTYVGFRPNRYFYQNLMAQTSKDLRKNICLAWDYKGTKFKSSIPWMGTKFWCWNMNMGYDSNNYPVFRYGDAVLMLSEVYNAKGDMAKALGYLNQVKTRAGIANVDFFSSDEAMLEEIQRERGRELIGEFQRKFDLVRWGVWYKQTYNNTDYALVRENILPCHRFYPIPDNEVGLSGGNLDNKEYDRDMSSF